MKKNAQFRLAVPARNIFLAIAVLITAGFWSSNAFAAKPDFSGQWKLNEGKSEIGEGRFRPSVTLEVKQDKVQLVVVSTRTGRDGTERKMEAVYNLDGTETTSGDENRSTVSTVKWSEDGKSLVIHSKRSFTREGQTFEMESDETWTLGEGGKVLSIQSKTSSSRGESSAKLVYDKI